MRYCKRTLPNDNYVYGLGNHFDAAIRLHSEPFVTQSKKKRKAACRRLLLNKANV